jgi:hypothetical protein
MGDLNADRTRMNEFYAYCERATKDYKSFGAPTSEEGVETPF